MNKIDLIALNIFGDFLPSEIETLMESSFNPSSPFVRNLFKDKKLNHKLENYFKKFDVKLLNKELKRIEKSDIEILTFWDEEYPPLLREIPSPPIVLYCRGKIETLVNNPMIAVVGTRKPTAYGKRIAKDLTTELVKEGFIIVSGVAAGIDTIAHSTAVENLGKTIGVLGCGINVVYPSYNSRIYDSIVKSGCLISEYPLDTAPLKYNFPRRNRIIAGLSLGTLVIEASEKSGSLITARLALEYNRNVFAVPGNINSVMSLGTNKLIKFGAKLTMCVEDIKEEFPYLNFNKKEVKRDHEGELSKDEQVLIEKIKEGKNEFDVLLSSTNWSFSKLSELLTQLEIKGFIFKEGGRFIAGI
ncbi:MAG TPA: DNA-protecting protein DprA [Thermotogaceae bacterium]|nr:DNA-processing protein DprA [Thermotogota bacterium]HEW92336.1 DNA-protecting protein DprA [Thermotogaceae bacterium]